MRRACVYSLSIPELTTRFKSNQHRLYLHSTSPDMASNPPTGGPTPQPEPAQKPVGYPFHEYLPTRVEPCAVDTAGKSVPFHLLDCGHIVAADGDDTRCGINCLHVTTWMTQKLSQQQEESIDLAPDKSLFQSLTTSAARPHNAIKPPLSVTQGHDKLFCEMCHGMPFASYNLAKGPDHELRRGLSLTRPVIEHFTDYDANLFEYFLAKMIYNPQHKELDYKYTHYLTCGHEVWCSPVRPCAANCKDMPPCRGRSFPYNVKQGDAILCKECTYRAELVYSRYIMAGRGGAQAEAARHGLPDQALQNGHNSNGTGGQPSFGGQDGVSYPDPQFGDLNTSGLDNDMLELGAEDEFGMFYASQMGLAGHDAATKGMVLNQATEHGPRNGTGTCGTLNLDPSLR